MSFTHQNGDRNNNVEDMCIPSNDFCIDLLLWNKIWLDGVSSQPKWILGERTVNTTMDLL